MKPWHVGAALVGGFVALSIFASMLPEEPKAPEPVKVSKPRPPLVVQSYSKLGVYRAGSLALDLGKDGKLTEPVVVVIESTDAYGKTATAPGFTLLWNADDLAKVDWTGMDSTRMINLARLKDGGVDGIDGAAALNTWCNDPKNGPMTPGFCGRWRDAVN